jgi:hypothetical protein
MPKQSKNKTISVETERRRAEILHNRRVKEILEENERKRTPFERWIRQSYRLNMNLPSNLNRTDKTYFSHRMRSGLIVNNTKGHPRFALRRPKYGVETNPSTIISLSRGDLLYEPEGIRGVTGAPLRKYDDEEDEGSGKPKHKKKAKAAKRS